jgi:hypothetical protein
MLAIRYAWDTFHKFFAIGFITHPLMFITINLGVTSKA